MMSLLEEKTLAKINNSIFSCELNIYCKLKMNIMVGAFEIRKKYRT